MDKAESGQSLTQASGRQQPGGDSHPIAWQVE